MDCFHSIDVIVFIDCIPINIPANDPFLGIGCTAGTITVSNKVATENKPPVPPPVANPPPNNGGNPPNNNGGNGVGGNGVGGNGVGGNGGNGGTGLGNDGNGGGNVPPANLCAPGVSKITCIPMTRSSATPLFNCSTG